MVEQIGSKCKTQGKWQTAYTISQLLTQPQDISANGPIATSDDNNGDRLGDWRLHREKIAQKYAEMQPCEECGINKGHILHIFEELQPHLPQDLPFSEESTHALQLKLYLCTIYNHVVDPFNSATRKFAMEGESENQACEKCGFQQAIVLLLLQLSSPYLTQDESLLDTGRVPS